MLLKHDIVCRSYDNVMYTCPGYFFPRHSVLLWSWYLQDLSCPSCKTHRKCLLLSNTKALSFLMKLAGSSWGANANTLRSSALALCYSVAEYCCPIWQRSTLVSLVDAQPGPHSSMRLISGTIRSTPLPSLPVLTNIEPPALRRRAATHKLITQAECHCDWPLYDDVFHPPPLCLELRKPLWRDLQTMSEVGGGKTGNRLQWSIPLQW